MRVEDPVHPDQGSDPWASGVPSAACKAPPCEERAWSVRAGALLSPRATSAPCVRGSGSRAAYRIIARGTVEEKAAELQRRRRRWLRPSSPRATMLGLPGLCWRTHRSRSSRACCREALLHIQSSESRSQPLRSNLLHPLLVDHVAVAVAVELELEVEVEVCDCEAGPDRVALSAHRRAPRSVARDRGSLRG
jgi:hypothetical protein